MRTWVFVMACSLPLASLERGSADQGPAPQASVPPGLARGDTVPPFDAEGVDGVAKHVGYAKGSTTLLLFFLSGCPTCHRMIPFWNRAYERRPRSLEVIGVMLDQEPPGFFMATPISFLVLRPPGRTPAERRAFAESFKIRGVPVTVRVGAGGTVEDIGQGLLDPIRLGELFRP